MGISSLQCQLNSMRWVLWSTCTLETTGLQKSYRTSEPCKGRLLDHVLFIVQPSFISFLPFLWTCHMKLTEGSMNIWVLILFLTMTVYWFSQYRHTKPFSNILLIAVHGDINMMIMCRITDNFSKPFLWSDMQNKEK